MRSTRESLQRVPIALRVALTRPASVMLAMGAAGMLGFRLARRSQATSSSGRSSEAAPTPNLFGTFLARCGIHYAAAVLRRAWVAHEDGVARAGVQLTKSSAAANCDTAVRQ